MKLTTTILIEMEIGGHTDLTGFLKQSVLMGRLSELKAGSWERMDYRK